MKGLREVLLLGAALLCVVSVGCGGSSSPKMNAITQTGQNVASITVNAGPAGNFANGAFVTVTVCVPGTTQCDPISGVLVDTGSSGLRILSSALNVPLPQQNTAGGNPVVECLPFLDSFTWGPVQMADVEIAGEKASAVPIQVLSDTDFKVPTGCTDFGVHSADTLSTLNANGILGVGLFAQDCGGACESTGPQNPGLYYECPSSGCVLTAEALSQQVPNPVGLFSSDNNGVVIELPAVAAEGETTVSGSLVFGIGTQSNNALGSAKVFTPDATGSFTVSYKGVSYPGSFIDSGSNGYFFLDSATTGLPDCTTATGFYCPTSTTSFPVTTQGNNGASAPFTFSIANAETLFATQSDTAFGDLGGPAPMPFFDLGLPFFYGRNVFTAIEGKTAGSSTGPFWAY